MNKISRPAEEQPGTEASRGWPVLSLFSGAGGLDLGFRTSGFSPKLAIDNNPAAIATYRHNHSQTAAIQLDIAHTPSDALVKLWKDHVGHSNPFGIIGGPPCQAFSSANVHQRNDDPRRDLLARYADIILEFSTSLQLDFFLFENVPGLTNRYHKHCFDQFENMCDEAGFEIKKKVIDAGNFGIPQRRKRLIVVGVNRSRFPGVYVQLPDGDRRPLTVREVLEGLPEPSFCTRGPENNVNAHHPNHVAMVPRSHRFKDGSLKPGDRRGLSFKVLDWDSPSYTVAYGHNEIHVHPECHRRLSVYEAMLLQGFPDHYRLHGTFTQQIQQVSDAVPPPLGEGIASVIAHTLGYPGSANSSLPASTQSSYL